MSTILVRKDNILHRGDVMKGRYIGNDVMLLSSLREMEIVEISEGRRLGFISDIILDDELNTIEALVVPPQAGIFAFLRRRDETIIPWKCIKTFGEDIILVDMTRETNNELDKKTLNTEGEDDIFDEKITL